MGASVVTGVDAAANPSVCRTCSRFCDARDSARGHAQSVFPGFDFEGIHAGMPPAVRASMGPSAHRSLLWPAILLIFSAAYISDMEGRPKSWRPYSSRLV